MGLSPSGKNVAADIAGREKRNGLERGAHCASRIPTAKRGAASEKIDCTVVLERMLDVGKAEGQIGITHVTLMERGREMDQRVM